jgi:uncharacterized protein (TIGR02996 family)
MADLHPDEHGFQAHLDQHPDDWDHRRVFSDWLEEQGRLPEAETQKWMAQNQKHPRFLGGTGTTDSWLWGAEGWGWRGEHHPIQPWHLPDDVADHFQFPTASEGPFTRRDMESSLTQALTRLKQRG